MNKDYPMQTVDGEDAPILGSVLPFPKDGEGKPKMTDFPMQTTIEGEEDSMLSDAIFDVIYYSPLGIFSMVITAFVVHLLVQRLIIRG